jgi:hypothetical protein
MGEVVEEKETPEGDEEEAEGGGEGRGSGVGEGGRQLESCLGWGEPERGALS